MLKKITINNKYGILSAYRTDVLNKNFNGVFKNNKNFVVLEFIKVSQSKKGYGNKLMDQFLKKLEDYDILILETCPLLGYDLYGSNIDELIVIRKLRNFYRKYNFRKYPNSKIIMYRKNI